MKPSLAPIAAVSVLLGVAFGASGCSVDGQPAPAAEEPESTEDAISGSCTYPRRYMAVSQVACTELIVERGRWVPTPLFPDAPEESGACFYTWSGERYARVERAALAEHVGLAGVLTPSCGNEDIDDADLYQIPVLPAHGMAGSVGCDVCGLHRDGKLWLVIPPELDLERQFEVRLSTGGSRAFQLTSAPGARLMAVTLPPAPAGTQYVNGRVAVY